MMNFALSFFVINFIRKKLKSEVDKFDLETSTKYLAFFILPGALFIDLSLPEKFDPTVNLMWFGLFSYILYILWILKENNLAFTLLKAGLPYIIIKSFTDFFDFFLPDFKNEYENEEK